MSKEPNTTTTESAPKMHVSTNEFRGKKIFGIRKKADDQYPYVSFGVEKAKVILAHLDEIRKYVADNS